MPEQTGLVIDPRFDVPYSKHNPPKDRAEYPWLAVVCDGSGISWASRFQTQELAESNARQVSELMDKPYAVERRP